MRALTIAGLLAAVSVPGTAAELLVNGDFEAGITNFDSGYTYVAPSATALQTPGTYTVARNAGSVNPAFADYGDKTSGSGLYLIVSGAAVGGGLVWSQDVDVVAGVEYKFKGYISGASALNPASIEVRAAFDDGAPEFLGRFTPPSMVGNWLGIEAGFVASGNRLRLSILATTSGSDGNDFGLDDLRLVGPDVPVVPPAVPEPGTWLLMIAGFGLAGTALRHQRAVRRSERSDKEWCTGRDSNP